ncbi:hypothetical protein LMG28727_06180 [Paraburkholderia kirstenboschensis]|nr:hypothetical protein LMG28727_06180 [Paraburkholderia kirstenboschensis]
MNEVRDEAKAPRNTKLRWTTHQIRSQMPSFICGSSAAPGAITQKPAEPSSFSLSVTKQFASPGTETRPPYGSTQEFPSTST